MKLTKTSSKIYFIALNYPSMNIAPNTASKQSLIIFGDSTLLWNHSNLTSYFSGSNDSKNYLNFYTKFSLP